MKIQASRLCKKFNSLTKEEREFTQGVILYHRQWHYLSQKHRECLQHYSIEDSIQTFAAGKLSKHPHFIGNGAFSAVFNHPSDLNKVIKIQISQDDESARFYELACKLDDPNFIKVYAMDHCLGHNVFVLERANAIASRHRAAIMECEYKEWRTKHREDDLVDHCTVEDDDVAYYIRIALRVRNRIHKYFKQFALDLHPGNWGTRNDGTLVVLDPIC